MGIFKSLFGKSSPADYSITGLPYATEQELLEAFGGIGLDKQRDLHELIGESNWNIDIPKGEITFGSVTLPVQILGSFSRSSETWLWGWANTQTDIPPKHLLQAKALQDFGTQKKIDLLDMPQYKAEINDLHRIGMIASGIFDSGAYYLADYGEGVLLVTLEFDTKTLDSAAEQLRILSVFPQLISLFELNHRTALQSYLEQKGYSLKADEASVTATKNGQQITAAFDSESRMTQLNG